VTRICSYIWPGGSVRLAVVRTAHTTPPLKLVLIRAGLWRRARVSLHALIVCSVAVNVQRVFEYKFDCARTQEVADTKFRTIGLSCPYRQKIAQPRCAPPPGGSSYRGGGLARRGPAWQPLELLPQSAQEGHDTS
jgi:hypothetical protein